MHSSTIECVRTTVEITEAQRGELLKIASGRGEKGFSSVVRDAVDLYLQTYASRLDAVRAALGVRGALAGREGEALKAEVSAVRKKWR
jgi:hypothetical protein